ncbi:MAG: antitoxin family protein [Chloroflexota bacterium]|nr:antitoxin family protein [Chloroflexota bacterium]MDE2895175.1 antitoxin family protein [Chloroflexota bacterium]
MATRIRARYVDGALIPFPPLDPEEGCQRDIAVEHESRPQTIAEYLEWLKHLQDTVPADNWDELPADAAQRFRDYRHGIRSESA